MNNQLNEGDQLFDFLKDHSVEEAFIKFQGFSRESIVRMKTAIEYQLEVSEGLRYAREVQTSIRFAGLFLGFAVICGAILTWMYDGLLLSWVPYIYTNYFMVRITLSAIVLMAFLNVWDVLKGYNWKDIDFESLQEETSDYLKNTINEIYEEEEEEEEKEEQTEV